ncbi:hypothetical protein [Pseudorhodoplanes sp.]|uniref:hypothetical protein n=1 Tax=Pseudorhodoplanes sp. TaxID=1934341 RepID=UPI002C2CF3B0|nr:hypothetical protein [Pseudorhodoplanes sp.]HWV41786.1 hypothetical protein [Pseudorhodoplanes sp.]
MIRKIALVSAATLFSASIALAQSSAPSSTAGGAQGTSKSGQFEKQTGAKPSGRVHAPKGTTGAAPRGHSSPDSTAGGAVGTTKGTGNVPGSR